MTAIPLIPTPEVLQALAARLTELNYTEARAAEALDLAHLGHFFEQAHSLYSYSLRRADPTLALLVRLFLLNEPIEIRPAIDLLGKELLIGLVRGAVMAVAEEGFVRCRYLLNPIDGAYIFTDRRSHSDENKLRTMPLGHDTYNLVTQTQKRPGARVLDLGTGSGVQGVLAARWASHVVSLDINPRALEMCRLNAHLNGVADRIELKLGSLYDPVAGQRFGVILANPPFVPNQEYEVLFHDGGVQGEDILHIIIRDAPDHLEPGGLLQIMTEIIYHDDRGPAVKVREWAEDRLRGVIFEQDDGFLDIYAEEHILRAASEMETNQQLKSRIDTYQQFLDSVHIHKITHATLHLEPDSAPEGVPAAARCPVVEVPVANLRAVGVARVAAGLAQVARVKEPDWPERLAAQRATFDPDLRVLARWQPCTGQPMPTLIEFAPGSPWRKAELEPRVFPLLRLVAETETVGEWFAAATEELGMTAEETRPLLASFFAGLVRDRWVTLVGPAA